MTVEVLWEKYFAMAELEKSYPECREMLEGLCRRILADNQMLAKAKLVTAAALSMIYIFTDGLMVFEFMREEKTGFAHIMMGSIFVNLGLQLMMVIGQNLKLGWRKVLKEVLIVFTCIKPGVDAFRVASGTEIVEDQTVDPKTEISFTKGVELCAEAILGMVVQMSAIISTGSNTSSNAAFSFACCVLTAAFTSSNMSYDWDTGKEGRNHSPSFYGYVPDKTWGKVPLLPFGIQPSHSRIDLCSAAIEGRDDDSSESALW